MLLNLQWLEFLPFCLVVLSTDCILSEEKDTWCSGYQSLRIVKQHFLSIVCETSSFACLIKLLVK